ncbi:MAG TPA: transcriptional repressor NrdR [candidate division Zixibacteria bacterium]|nr:transcriptional repressor NrdR [candidate division Zixibacteria bacterium]
MKCPFCNEDSDKVVDSRSVREGSAVRRRRECLSCGNRFTTYEFVEESQVSVVKRDGRREPFDREKIVGGLKLACRKRPINADEIDGIANAIEAELSGRNSFDVNSDEIGEMVMARLSEMDRVAYIRFASVYRNFEDVGDFETELSKLKTKTSESGNDESPSD